ncbi:hypothetical protein ACO0K9_16215 [Undibacterium sp. Ji50W]|uniref:hypothetical protein n=1 Tax=Undibacterium sp. Ji50W TaxID=3413041 RepID=UPI003BEF5FEF
MPSIEKQTSERCDCPCGCGQSASLLSGSFNYTTDRYVVFRTVLLQCDEGGAHVWSILRSGPWFKDDKRDCWLTLHTWINEKNLATRIEDPENSPFSKLFLFTERLLTREEVLLQPGGKEWAFRVHGGLIVKHKEISAFLLKLTDV